MVRTCVDIRVSLVIQVRIRGCGQSVGHGACGPGVCVSRGGAARGGTAWCQVCPSGGAPGQRHRRLRCLNPFMTPRFGGFWLGFVDVILRKAAWEASVIYYVPWRSGNTFCHASSTREMPRQDFAKFAKLKDCKV